MRSSSGGMINSLNTTASIFNSSRDSSNSNIMGSGTVSAAHMNVAAAVAAVQQMEGKVTDFSTVNKK